MRTTSTRRARRDPNVVPLERERGEFPELVLEYEHLASLADTLPADRRKHFRLSLDHHLPLAVDLQRRFGDLLLSVAALLGPLPVSELSMEIQQRLGNERVGLLLERDRIKDAGETRRSFFTETLPSLSDSRPALLLIYGWLRSADPRGLLSAWTQDFRIHPQGEMPDPPPLDAIAVSTSPSCDPVFIDNVVLPCCEHFLLWHEKHVVQDLRLFMGDRERALQLHAFARSLQEKAARAQAKIHAEVGAPLAGVQHFWEWKNIGELDRQLPASEASFEPVQLPLCGRMVICSGSEEESYRLLYHLNHCFACTGNNFFGFTNLGDRSSREIQTKLIQVEVDGTVLRMVNVSVVTVPEVRLLRHRMKSGEIRGASRLNAQTMIQVYAPDGRVIQLPLGSTVLNFALQIHHHFVALVRRARVNQANVDVLHELRMGDVVHLYVESVASPLPAGWEAHVPDSTVARIRLAFRRRYSDELIQHGHEYLVDRIRSLAHKSAEITSRDIDAELAALSKAEYWSANWNLRKLLTQIGLYTRTLAGDSIPEFRQEISIDLIDRIVKELQKRLISRRPQRFFLLEGLPFDATNVRTCPRCEPDPLSEFVGCRQGGDIVIHRPHATCATGKAYNAVSRTLLEPHYVLLRTRNVTGIAANVCDVFRDLEVPIEDLAATGVSPGFGVFRFQISPLSRQKLTELEARLRMEGVDHVQVHALERGELERHLPPRRGNRERHWHSPAPYLCGPEVVDDRYFYGMRMELSELRGLYDDANRSSADRSVIGFVRGPRKVGKSSLVLKFLRDLAVDYGGGPVSIYYEGSLWDDWLSVEKELSARLVAKLQHLHVEARQIREFKRTKSLQELLSKAMGSVGGAIILAVDEATGILSNACKESQEKKILELKHWLDTNPGVLLLLCGLESPIASLPVSIQDLLQESRAITVEGLGAGEVKDLLCAKNLSPSIHIQISNALANRIGKDANGNPHWVARLGASMWSKVSNKDIAHYTQPIFELARGHVIVDGLTFVDRLSVLDDASNPQLASAIVRVLSAESSEPRKRVIKYTLGEIQAELEIRGMAAAESNVSALLEELKAGGVVTDEMITGKQRWSILAPILRDALKNHVG